jgi:mannose-6-phosphate isomerase-like protein (cupin superfamily)
METQFPYTTLLDIKFDHFELIDIPTMIRECKDKWWNQTLTRVNDSVVRLGIVEGEYHWHKHDREDEFFLCLEGQFIIELENETVTLNPMQGYTITKGVMHKPRAPKRTVILMVEPAGIQPTGS